MERPPRHFYEFGAYRIDTSERLLLRDNGENVPLTPKAFDTLLTLVENSGRLLKKDELIEKIWPGSFIEENNLAQNVSALRKALGVDAEGHQYIETVPRRGYRFTARVTERWEEPEPSDVRGPVPAFVNVSGPNEPSMARTDDAFERADDVMLVGETESSVSPLQGSAPSSAADAEAGRAPALTLHRRHWIAVALILLALLLPGGLLLRSWLMRQHAAREQSAATTRTLAILPFQNLKQDAETDFLGFSLADAIITKLSYLNEIRIRPSSYIDRYRNQSIDPKRVAAELNVDTLLIGRYMRDGEDLRVTAQLIDVTNNTILRHETIDLKYNRLFTVEDRVAQQIISGLRLSLSPAEAERLKLDTPRDPRAYEYYLRGVDLYVADNFPTAVGMFEKSVEVDPNYALAWAHLGRAYTAVASFQFGGREYHTKALTAYERSLALNPELVEARIFMSNLLTDTNQVERAVPLLRAVIEVHPDNAEAHWELSYAYRFAGMLEASIEEGERARRLDPKVKITSSAFNTYLYSGQYQKFLDSLPNDTETPFILFYRGLGNYYLNNRERAAADFDRAYQLDPSLYTHIGKAINYAIAGQSAKGLELLQDMEKRIADRGVTDAEGIYKVAQAYAMLGDRPSAIRVLRRSIDGGFFCYPYFMADPLLQNLHGEREFTELMEMARQRHEKFRQQFFG